VVDDYLPALDFSETRFIANISGSTVDEYYEVTRIFDDSPIDAMEINISCPNVKEGGAGVRQQSGYVGSCRGSLPEGHAKAVNHQAVTQPDGHC
jgi:dihydroorotate dehydrogenase